MWGFGIEIKLHSDALLFKKVMLGLNGQEHYSFEQYKATLNQQDHLRTGDRTIILVLQIFLLDPSLTIGYTSHWTLLEQPGLNWTKPNEI